MKKMRKILIILLVILAGCETYETPSIYTFVVTAYYPNEISHGSPIANQEILLHDLQSGREYLSITNEKGIADFSVRGGNYDLVISFSEEHEIEVGDHSFLKTVQFNGALHNQSVLEEGNQFHLGTEYSIIEENFVIKELYSSGSRTPEGKTYSADKFVEIYNNSNRVLYSDGLCFGVIRHMQTYEPSPWVDANGDLLPRTPLWSFVAIIPGSGQENPIHPGDSFIIALSGLNHKDDSNGNPNSIDLSGADWEFFVEDGKYIDVPAVPNMLMNRITQGTAMLMETRAQSCILFRLPSGNLEDIFNDQNNYMVEPGGKFNCFMVPHDWVLDGIDNLRLDDRGAFKRLPGKIDVGYVQHRGSYEKVSIRRKVKEVIDGRTVYLDTNNSTNDFLTDQEPAPGVIAKN